jgi:hypothetical protein
MNLPEALRRQKEDFLEKAPEDVVSVMSQATEKLANSGLLQNCLQVGEQAPEFSLRSSRGTMYTLSDELSKGPVILKFFRGDW